MCVLLARVGAAGAAGSSAFCTAVAGNTAVTTPEPAALVTVSASATVKKFSVTLVRVKPVLGIRVMVAVYAVAPANLSSTIAGLQFIVPVYCSVSFIVGTGAHLSPVQLRL